MTAVLASDGLLTVKGTKNFDDIVISRKGAQGQTLMVSEKRKGQSPTTTSFNYTAVSRIVVNLGAASDRFIIGDTDDVM